MAEPVLTALLALWLASAALGLVGAAVFAWQTRRFARVARGFVPPEPAPGAAVIVPLKGAAPYAPSCLAAMLAQDYPRYRLIAAVESSDDPAHALVQELIEAGGSISVVIAGRAEGRGQKVHNLLAGLAALEPGDSFVCFADADALWSPDTLSTLMRELSVWTGPLLLLSGYRWMFPVGGRAGAVWAAAANLPVAAAAKSPAWDLAWGGTMASARGTLERIDLAALWDRSLSDDVPLSGALRRRGFVKLMPNLVVPSPADFSIQDALNFARRQYAMLRVYAPRHWLFSALVYAVFFAGFGASVAALCMPVAAHVAGMALAALGLTVVRGLAHAALVWRLLPRAAARRMGWVCALDTLLPFVPAALHAYGLLASVRTRRISWAGITYTLDGKRVVRVDR